MSIQFPSSFPLVELLQRDIDEIAKNGLPFFDVRWLRDEQSLINQCINVIASTWMNSSRFETLPPELIEKIHIKVLENRLFQATQCVFPWMNSSKNPNKNHNFFHFINEFVFEKFLIAYPALDLTNRDIQAARGVFSIDIAPKDFDRSPILRLMKGSACVGISFLLHLEKGSLVPWTFMQGYSTDPNIWCPFNDSPGAPFVFAPSLLFKIKDIAIANLQAEIAINEIKLAKLLAQPSNEIYHETTDLIKFWESQNEISLLIKTLRKLISGQSIQILENQSMQTITTAHLAYGNLSTCIHVDLTK